MKKIGILLLPFLLLLGCSGKTYTEIKMDTLKKKIENKESLILFIGATSCEHCKDYKTTINEVIKEYNITVYYIDVDKLSEKEENDLTKIARYQFTPTTVFIKDGKEESTYTRIVGARDYDYIVNKLNQNGWIKKVEK